MSMLDDEDVRRIVQAVRAVFAAEQSVTGEVRSSSIVPDRFSSEYVFIVIIGSRNRTSTLAFCRSGRIMSLLTFTCGVCPNCDCIPCRTK